MKLQRVRTLKTETVGGRILLPLRECDAQLRFPHSLEDGFHFGHFVSQDLKCLSKKKTKRTTR